MGAKCSSCSNKLLQIVQATGGGPFSHSTNTTNNTQRITDTSSGNFIDFPYEEVLQDTSDFSGAAPANVKLAVNTATGAVFYVDQTNNYQPLDIARYELVHNTATWTGPTSGEYVITIPAATHGMGTSVEVFLYRDIGGTDWELTNADREYIDQSTGDIEIAVPQVPDLRYDGRIVVGYRVR